MTIWVDADACPRDAKTILFKAASRTETETVLVANHYMQVPNSPFIRLMQVQQGFDVADDTIVALIKADDLVVTSDIPLAADAIAKSAQVITSRGEKYTKQNIGQRLNMRDFMETMRSTGEVKGGPPAYGQKEKQAFANALDQYLAKQRK